MKYKIWKEGSCLFEDLHLIKTFEEMHRETFVIFFKSQKREICQM